MSRTAPRSRILVDMSMTGILFLSFAYYWQGNLVHEVMGCVLFVGLIVHNTINRRWYRGLVHMGKAAPLKQVHTVVTLLLLLLFGLVLVTSVLISQSVLMFVFEGSGYFIRQLHVFFAYWIVIIASIHIGLRWVMLKGLLVRALGCSRALYVTPTLLMNVAAHLLAISIVIVGVFCFVELDFLAQLTMHVSMNFWDFSRPITLFFGHILAVMGMVIVLTHYLTQLFVNHHCGY